MNDRNRDEALTLLDDRSFLAALRSVLHTVLLIPLPADLLILSPQCLHRTLLPKSQPDQNRLSSKQVSTSRVFKLHLHQAITDICTALGIDAHQTFNHSQYHSRLA